MATNDVDAEDYLIL